MLKGKNLSVGEEYATLIWAFACTYLLVYIFGEPKFGSLYFFKKRSIKNEKESK